MQKQRQLSKMPKISSYEIILYKYDVASEFHCKSVFSLYYPPLFNLSLSSENKTYFSLLCERACRSKALFSEHISLLLRAFDDILFIYVILLLCDNSFMNTS